MCYPTDEVMCTTKGFNAVISYLHHFLVTGILLTVQCTSIVTFRVTNPSFDQRLELTMADGGTCRGKVLVLGHSYVRRLGVSLAHENVEVYMDTGDVLWIWWCYGSNFEGKIE